MPRLYHIGHFQSSNAGQPRILASADGGYAQHSAVQLRVAGHDLPLGVLYRARLDYNVGESRENCCGGDMRADRVEVSWDGGKSDWVVRIQSGEEVIRRHCKAPKDADEKTLRAKAEETVKDEGYEANAEAVSIKR